MEVFQQISELLQKGKAKDLVNTVQQAIDDGLAVQEILEQGLLSGMNIVGQKFKDGEAFLPEVMISARAMNKAMEKLKPLLVASGVEPCGKVVIGTVKGDVHDIGKNLVRMMMEGKGFDVIDLGVDVSAERYIQAAIESKAQIIACSALLTTTMGEMKSVVEAAQQAGIRENVTIMVGGAPVTDEFCKSIGADIYTKDAASAADAAFAVVSK